MGGTDNVEKGLRRGDAEVTLSALLRVSPSERTPFLAAAGALFSSAVLHDFRHRKWSQLTSWASRAERLDGLTVDEPTSWALMWGALMTKEHERARRWFGPLREPLTLRNPALAQAIEALFEQRLTPALAEPVLRSSVGTPDPRLGYDTVRRPRAAWSCPQSVAEVEPGLLALVGQEPWSVFQSRVTQGAAQLQGKSEEVEAALWLLAGQLAAREIVNRFASGAHSTATEPAELLRSAVLALKAPAALSDDVLTVFRLVASRIPSPVESAEVVKGLAPVLQTAAAYPAHRPLVVGLVTSTLFGVNAATPMIELIEVLLQHEASVPLVAKALMLHVLAGPRSRACFPSPSIMRYAQLALDRDAAGFAAWFSSLGDQERAHFSGWLGFAGPPSFIQSFVLKWLPLLSGRAEADLLQIVEEVALGDDLHDCGNPHCREHSGPRQISSEVKTFWVAVRNLVLPKRPGLLGLALDCAQPNDDLGALVNCALGPTPRVGQLIEVWDLLRTDKRTGLATAVEKRFFASFGHDLHALAEAITLAVEYKAPVAFKRKLADALFSNIRNLDDVPKEVRPAAVVAARWMLERTATKRSATKPARQRATPKKRATQKGAV